METKVYINSVEVESKKISILNSKHGFAFNQNMLLGLIVGIIFIVILVSMSSTLIPTGAVAYHNMSDTLAANGEALGTDAAAFAGNTDSWLGWFWVVGPFILVIYLVINLFLKPKRNGGSYRRYRR